MTNGPSGQDHSAVHAAFTEGRTAVITGGASGIGLAVATRCATLGMKICIADVDELALAAASKSLAGAVDGVEVLTVPTDVSELAQVQELKRAVLERFGEIAVLMNNAGTGPGGGPWSRYEGWQRVMAINLWGVINGVHTFSETLIEQGTPCAIINTGSKQGITNPPGDAAYNVTKAGVKAITESLAHQLRQIEGHQVSAHLLVPGFTYTGLIKRHLPEQPPGAWTPEQVADELLRRVGLGDFYIICPDNDVTTEMDNKRIQWAAGDMTENRSALSRWDLDYEDAFQEFMQQ